MCCVGGMVEETMREATGHEFEPRHTRIYPDIFFLRNSTFSTGRRIYLDIFFSKK